MVIRKFINPNTLEVYENAPQMTVYKKNATVTHPPNPFQKKKITTFSFDFLLLPGD